MGWTVAWAREAFGGHSGQTADKPVEDREDLTPQSSECSRFKAAVPYTVQCPWQMLTCMRDAAMGHRGCICERGGGSLPPEVVAQSFVEMAPSTSG